MAHGDINPSGRQRNARYSSVEPVMIAGFEEVKFEVEGPNGKPVTITYGAATDSGRGGQTASDCLTTRYRSEDYRAYGGTMRQGIESLRADLAKAEVEYQSKSRVAKARKDAAANPIDACIFVNDRIEDVKVRGIDQRNGSALIIRTGEHKVSWAKASLYRSLDRDEKADIHRLADARTAAAAKVKTLAPTKVSGALAGDEVDLVIHYDVEADRRWTEFDGRRFEGRSEQDIVSVVYAHLLLTCTPYRYVVDHQQAVAIGGADSVRSYYDVYLSMADWRTEQDVKAAASEAQARLDLALSDLVFDLSLFEGVTSEAETVDALADSLPSITAPEGSGDWDE